MFGLFLIWSGALFEEVSSVAGKNELESKKEAVAVFGFLQTLILLIVFFVISQVIPDGFVFSWKSLPTLSLRIIFEIALCYFAIMALKLTDRSSFGFVRSGTIPLLLIVDILVGYTVTPFQIVGVLLLFVVIAFVFKEHVIKKKGLKYLVACTLLPVVTVSLYKYDITHFNSFAAETTIVMAALVLFWTVVNIYQRHSPLKHLKDPQVVVQVLAAAIGSILINIAFVFTIPSVLIAVKRASSIFWSTLSGIYMYREKRVATKVCIAGALLVVIFTLF
jgi:hypothetical protein